MTTILQNVVFPLDRDPDLLPLYADPETWSTVDGEAVRLSSRAHIGNVLGRNSIRIVAGRRVSLATYFNAFPASYWQHWTTVRDIRLTVRTSGPATVLVYRSNGSGVKQRIDIREVEGETESTFELALNQYGDGGWIWFDVVADQEAAVLRGGEWSTDQEPKRTGKASLGITTFNKPDYCVRTLQALADAPEVLELVDRIFLVDQGNRKVAVEPGFDDAAAALGDTLAVINQANLGGSGGFARAMTESLRRPETGFVQLLDDDVDMEPESLRRSIMFGRFATHPTIVGAHMFDLLDRTKLHAWAEVVDEDPYMWRALYQEHLPHDFAKANLRQTPMLHMRMDADYNGWWMCLIPVEVVRAIGLSLPAFIKWDDAEYCVRAGKAGYPTVSMPGVALWHVSWVGKDDSIDWQAYFHARNRIVAALLHSERPSGGRLIEHSRRVDLKHLMSMQYYPVALRHRALRDILSGPAHMVRTLPTAMPEARAVAAEFPETVVHADTEDLRARHGRQVYPLVKPEDWASVVPSGRQLVLFTAKTVARRWLRKAAPTNVEQPQVELSKGDAQWWRVPAFESALVATADGAGKNIYTHDRDKYRQLLKDSIALHRQLQKRWQELREQYRAALPELVSQDTWDGIFMSGSDADATPLAQRPDDALSR